MPSWLCSPLLQATPCSGFTEWQLRNSVAALGRRLAASRNLAALSASLLILVVGLLAMVYVLRHVIARARHHAARRERERELLRRQLISATDERPLTVFFPSIRSRIPNWIPDWLLEIITAPLTILGAKFPSFSSYRHRSRMLASAAIGLIPDVVHCHDCSALPTGWIVKKTLGVPLVYDAHEIYEAVASRRFGATDYFARVHAKYLPHVDGFVAVNDSAANYYRYSYPDAPRATVIRNATEYMPAGTYDGRLHLAAGLPAQQKIILYQGGFTRHRGLETLMRAARFAAGLLVCCDDGERTPAGNPQGHSRTRKGFFRFRSPTGRVVVMDAGRNRRDHPL